MLSLPAAYKGDSHSSFESQKVTFQSLNPTYAIMSSSVALEAMDKRTRAKKLGKDILTLSK